jgi:hypothetical protein
MVDDEIEEAIQNLLDKEGDGWTLTQYVVVMGIARMTDSGIEAIAWYYKPDAQPDWQTEGLLRNGLEIHINSEDEDED